MKKIREKQVLLSVCIYSLFFTIILIMQDEMDKSNDAFSPRRGLRQRKPSLKAQESVSAIKNQTKNIELIELSSDESDENQEKPRVLHEDDYVSGDKIFTFQKRKKCEAVTLPNVSKTPHSVRNKIKKNIASKIVENNSSDEDFSDSGSEYAVSEEESEEESVSEESDGSDNDLKFSKSCGRNITKLPATKTANREYVIRTDDYFSNHSSKKILTSNHTLDKLDTPRLPQDQLQKLLSKVELSNEHETCTNKLVDSNYLNFEKWMYLMHENINILLYGLGSKKEILNTFHEKYLKKLPTIVVNGFFPSLSIKDVLDSIILNLLELKENPSNVYESCELIEREFSYILDTHLYLIVHNIDMMRNGKAQSVFARLGAVSNIHLIASIDHINAPLIWDHSKLSKFNFTWWDVTSFQMYTDETSFESSMMVQKSGTLALSSLRNVFLSLTSNSKGIYLILVKYQIENGKKQYYQGLSFKDLYSSCREAFLVSSDLALRAQLTEFVDHKMVKYRRSPDGTEYLVIPIANTLLQQFLAEQSDT